MFGEKSKFPWFSECWQQFEMVHRNQSLPHAVLLEGTKGIGLEQVATEMAQKLLCVNEKQYALWQSEHGHPDFLKASPQGGQQIIKIEQIRELTEFVQKTAQQGGLKVVVIEQVDKLNLSAANALLKTLEEPSTKVHLILTTSHPGAVLPTILSRCIPWQIRLHKQQVLKYLTEQGVLETEANMWIKIFGLAPLKIKEWLSEVSVSGDNGRSYLNIVAKFLKPFDPVALAQEINNLSLDHLIVFIETSLKDLMFLLMKLQEKVVFKPILLAYQEWLSRFSSRMVSQAKVEDALQAVSQLKLDVSKPIALNKQLCFDRLCITLYQAFYQH